MTTAGRMPSGPASVLPSSISCISVATRISKNSSRLLPDIASIFTRSSSGLLSSCASSNTRRLNCSQERSRLRKVPELLVAGLRIGAETTQTSATRHWEAYTWRPHMINQQRESSRTFWLIRVEKLGGGFFARAQRRVKPNRPRRGIDQRRQRQASPPARLLTAMAERVLPSQMPNCPARDCLRRKVPAREHTPDA